MSQVLAGPLNPSVTKLPPYPSYLVFDLLLAYKKGFVGTEGTS